MIKSMTSSMRAENLQLMIDMMQRELEEVVRQQEHAENGAADVAQRQADPEAREPIGEAADVIPVRAQWHMMRERH